MCMAAHNNSLSLLVAVAAVLNLCMKLRWRVLMKNDYSKEDDVPLHM